ncbi:aminopeptidase N [Salsipaludibacter albus]|uniref:aminopeptidase N n=1 Tax=Salsipaludibacter albus TaxID=2849650 RepID=UPI001EE4B6E6|nr:aminopeptidase N [Salsipaludibacter albus]
MSDPETAQTASATGAVPRRPDTANLRRDETAARAAAVDLHAIDVVLDLSGAPDADRATFRSTTTIRFTSTGDSTWLDLVAPRVVEASVNGTPVDPAARHDGARLHLDGLVTGPDRVNEVVVVADCAYSHSGEGLHRFVDPVDDATYCYTQYEPADARRVFACFEQPDCRAPFTFDVLAPTGWQVRSNTAGTPTDVGDATTRWDFAPTKPIASYITTVLAGPYHVVTDTWTRAADERHDALEVPLAVLCRASLAEHLDADEVLEVTRAGLDVFHELFDVAYPFGRYDQAFVPEYNLGAMENPGLVTFNENYVFQSAVTEAERERRAGTILHEMAHMWFGDLVTMRWWDDLWLKESFADYMSVLASVRATRFTDAWTTFATSDKARAYRADQLPTTHPIVADIVDLEAAKLNFDGITYSKGASVLKQLVAWVGRDAFLAGANDYFARHAWGNTTLGDFLAALAGASGRDLADWSRTWLETAGVSELWVDLDDDGTLVTDARLFQQGTDPATGEDVLRPHRVAVGGYDVVDGRLVRTTRTEVDLAAGSVALDDLRGRPRPALVLPNDDDLSYAKVLLDEPSLATVRTHLSTLAEPLPRALVWSALWNAVRDARLPATDFLDVVADHGPAEDHPGSLATLHRQACRALTHHLPPDRRAAARSQLHAAAVATTAAAADGGDVQLAWLRLAIVLGTDHPAWLLGLLEGRGVPGGVVIDPELRWSALVELAASGAVERDRLDDELAADDRALTRRRHATALAARPTVEAKEAAWADAVTDVDLPNAMLAAVLSGWGRPDHQALTQRFEAPYLDGLEEIWTTRSIEMARRLVVGLFPPVRDVRPGRSPADHPTVRAVDAWLDDHADGAAALRRLVLEQRDQLVRSLAAQAVVGDDDRAADHA